MTVVTLPDAEMVIGSYLNADPDVAALDARAVAQLSPDFSRPVVRVHQIDATNSANSPVEHLVTYDLQLDCYAGSSGGRQEASELARTVRAVLKAAEGTVVDGQVISRVIFIGHNHLPDESFTPWRERYIVEAEVSMHHA